MFKIEKKKNIKWPVVINIPRDGGGTTQARITAEFELIGTDEYNAIFTDGGNDKDLIRRTLKNWDDVKDEDGNPLEFSSENVEMLIDISHVRSGLTAAYIDMAFGKKAAAKN